jgi:hypothetical protein
VVVGIIWLQVALSPLEFSAASFYVRHHSLFFWAAAWLVMFAYWHACAFDCYTRLEDERSKRSLIIYLLSLADVSFILSAVYVVVGYVGFGVNVCTDAPSVWCTFYVIQSVLIPLLFFRLPQGFTRRQEPTSLGLSKLVLLCAVSAAIVGLMILALPLFHCLSWKFIFP